MNNEGSKISNTEWGLVIGALFMIDLIQVVLEWLIIGLFINWIIDIFVGMSLALYLQLRGESMANPKRAFGLLATFGLEMIPILDELPLWGLDGIFNMVMSKADKIISKVPGGALLNQKIERNAKVIGINQDIKKQMAGFNSSGTNNPNTKNTSRPSNNGTYNLGEKNNNTQGSANKATSNTNSESKEKTNQHSGDKNNTQSRNEIDNLKKDIERYKGEIQQWEPEMKKKEEILKGHDDLAYHMIDSAREKGDENRARELSGMHQKGRAVMADQVISLSRQINRNKDIIFSMNNKLMNLERNNGLKR